MAYRYDIAQGHHPFENTSFLLRPLESLPSSTNSNTNTNTYILYLSFSGRLKGGITSPRFIQTTLITGASTHELLTTKPMSISDFNHTLKTVLKDICKGKVGIQDRNRVVIERLLRFDPDTEPLVPSSSLPVERVMCELYVLRKIPARVGAGAGGIGIGGRQRHCVVM